MVEHTGTGNIRERPDYNGGYNLDSLEPPSNERKKMSLEDKIGFGISELTGLAILGYAIYRLATHS